MSNTLTTGSRTSDSPPVTISIRSTIIVSPSVAEVLKLEAFGLTLRVAYSDLFNDGVRTV
jgi:hypothetical protein